MGKGKGQGWGDNWCAILGNLSSPSGHGITF